jgi:hypothetical protein
MRFRLAIVYVKGKIQSANGLALVRRTLAARLCGTQNSRTAINFARHKGKDPADKARGPGSSSPEN